MTERYGPSFGDEGGQRPSGRGAVTERLARRDQDAREIDLTDEAAQRPRPATTPRPGRPPGPRTTRPTRESSGRLRAGPGRAHRRPAGRGRAAGLVVHLRRRRAGQAGGPEPDRLRAAGRRPRRHPRTRPRGEDHRPEPGEAAREPDATRPADAEATALTDPGPGGRAATATRRPPRACPSPRPPPAPRRPPTPRPPPGLGIASRVMDADGIRNRFLDIQAGFVDEAPPGRRGGRPLRRRAPPAAGRRPPRAARPARRRDRRGLHRGPAPGPARLPPVRGPHPGHGHLSPAVPPRGEDAVVEETGPLRWPAGLSRCPGEPGGPG